MGHGSWAWVLKAYQNYETRESIITSKIRYVYENSSPGYDVFFKGAAIYIY
jgi:hypothetical protein